MAHRETGYMRGCATPSARERSVNGDYDSNCHTRRGDCDSQPFATCSNQAGLITGLKERETGERASRSASVFSVTSDHGWRLETA